MVHFILSSLFATASVDSTSTTIKPKIEGIAPVKSSFSPLERLEFEIVAVVPDSCYSLKKPQTRLDRDYGVILFDLRARPNGKLCAGKQKEERALVSLGPLSEGGYEVRELVSLKKWGKVYVDSAPHLRDTDWAIQEWANSKSPIVTK